MSITHEDVLRSALLLPESDRILIATELLDSISGDPPGLAVDAPGFEEELEKRFNDDSKSIPWASVREQLQKDVNQ